MYRIYGISIPKKELLEDYNKIRLQDLEIPLQCPASEKVESHAERTDEEIPNLKTLVRVPQDRGSLLAVQFGFEPS